MAHDIFIRDLPTHFNIYSKVVQQVDIVVSKNTDLLHISAFHHWNWQCHNLYKAVDKCSSKSNHQQDVHIFKSLFFKICLLHVEPGGFRSPAGNLKSFAFAVEVLGVGTLWCKSEDD